MEIKEHQGFSKQETEAVPTIINMISSNQVAGFDTIQENELITDPCQQNGSHFRSSIATETETTVVHWWNDVSQPTDSHRIQSVSISMPTTPSGHSSQTPKKVLFNEQNKVMSSTQVPDASTTSATTNRTETKFYSQPMSRSVTYVEVANGLNSHQNPEPQARTPRGDRPRDTRFDSFKTWSGRLERQLSNLRGKPEPEPEHRPGHNAEAEPLPVDRYFAALEGPELDTLRPSEELVLPGDRKWPFLLRFPISSFGICLGVSSQAILWKNLATSLSTHFLHISLTANMVLWSISIALVVIVASIYALKLIFYFEAVRREYYHPIRVNFFFAPFIALLFLALGVPPSVAKTLPHALWYVLMTPFLFLELKIYGQWMSGGQRRLSKVANPSNHLSIVGNFVGALLGASMGLKEGPLFFFAVGLAHYTVLFVTLYQRLPTNATLPKELHPVFFLFVAAPSVASMAWAMIQGSFDYGARIAYFIAMFLYFSLAVRINFFRGFRFSLAWWAYTFPMTGAAIATIKYSNEVTNWVTRGLAITLSVVAILTVTGMLVTTLLHAFVFKNLFPNDIAIAISDRPPKPRKRWFHLRTAGISDTKDIEHYLKFVTPDGKDLEASVDSSTTSTVKSIDPEESS